MLVLNVTLVRRPQKQNAASPMLVTPLPIMMVIRPAQFENAPVPMLVMLSGMVMLVMLLQT